MSIFRKIGNLFSPNQAKCCEPEHSCFIKGVIKSISTDEWIFNVSRSHGDDSSLVHYTLQHATFGDITFQKLEYYNYDNELCRPVTMYYKKIEFSNEETDAVYRAMHNRFILPGIRAEEEEERIAREALKAEQENVKKQFEAIGCPKV